MDMANGLLFAAAMFALGVVLGAWAQWRHVIRTFYLTHRRPWWVRQYEADRRRMANAPLS